jgi:hypothetical protein
MSAPEINSINTVMVRNEELGIRSDCLHCFAVFSSKNKSFFKKSIQIFFIPNSSFLILEGYFQSAPIASEM